jgi:thiamine biosynthesis lipoprotein
LGLKTRWRKTKNIVDSISINGYQKVKQLDGKLIKNDPRIQNDAKAIAQGFSVDLVAEF